jgi:DNA-binding transcriptional regulator/RsmH inhibitor MraZ
LKKKPDLTGSTLERRARTIRSWFRWIRNNLGIVEVDKHGRIRISKQLRLY